MTCAGGGGTSTLVGNIPATRWLPIDWRVNAEARGSLAESSPMPVQGMIKLRSGAADGKVAAIFIA